MHRARKRWPGALPGGRLGERAGAFEEEDHAVAVFPLIKEVPWGVGGEREGVAGVGFEEEEASGGEQAGHCGGGEEQGVPVFVAALFGVGGIGEDDVEAKAVGAAEP